MHPTRMTNPRTLLIALLLPTLTGCQQQAVKPMSIEQARSVTAIYSSTEVPVPPRSIESLRSRLSTELESWQSCNRDRPPPLADLYSIGINTKDSGLTSNHPDILVPLRLRRMAETEFHHGAIDRAIALVLKANDETMSHNVGTLGTGHATLARYYAAAGDVDRARSAIARAEVGSWDEVGDFLVYAGRAAVAALEGELSDAEQLFRRAAALRVRWAGWSEESQIELAKVVSAQGRRLEAEALLRKMLQQPGMSLQPMRRGRALLALSEILVHQGRSEEAELVARAAIADFVRGQTRCSGIFFNLAHKAVASSLLAQGRIEEAITQFEILREQLSANPMLFKRRFAGDVDWGLALLEAGRLAEARERLTLALEMTRTRQGAGSYREAEAAALLATVEARSNRVDVALSLFRDAVPVLLAAAERDEGETSARAAYERRFRRALEGYLELLLEIRGTTSERAADLDVVNESFRVADVLRGQVVQRAIAQSLARATVREPDLASLVRSSQDAARHVASLQEALVLASSREPSAEQRVAQNALQQRVQQLQAARRSILSEISDRFPGYFQLINPSPPTIASARKELRPTEALIAIYALESQTLVWAFERTGEVVFHVSTLKRAELSTLVRSLRTSIEPTGNRIADIPVFDVAAAHRVYRDLIAPVAAAWNRARQVVIAPHGPLTRIPFSMLAVDPDQVTADEGETGAMFSRYRTVQWLGARVSISHVPTVSTLLAIRAARPSLGKTNTLAAFGDPDFGGSTDRSGASRGVSASVRAQRLARRRTAQTRRLASATLRALPALPDTRDEVQQIATALGAELTDSVFVGARASESRVREMDLRDRRVIVFATHGLASGDLNGLTQPALAMSSPAVTGETGVDGLLTMNEIFTLELNADWVVLSACNTASADGTGADALSGLGRAFLYAGARSLLVTHWPVETQSAALMTTSIFALRASQPTLSRGEAMRATIEAMISRHGATDDVGRLLFSYAHPMFWAPFALIGDGS